jgi:hypothetical protein
MMSQGELGLRSSPDPGGCRFRGLLGGLCFLALLRFPPDVGLGNLRRRDRRKRQ